MLIKVYEDGIGNCLGLLHVNLSHVTTVYKIRKNVNSEYTYHVRLDDGRDYATCESCYDRITQWMADQEDARDLMHAVAVGAGTCEVEVIDTGNEAAYEHYEYIMHCKHCNHEYGYVQYDEDGDTWMDEPPNFCPNCGAKALSE